MTSGQRDSHARYGSQPLQNSTSAEQVSMDVARSVSDGNIEQGVLELSIERRREPKWTEQGYAMGIRTRLTIGKTNLIQRELDVGTIVASGPEWFQGLENSGLGAREIVISYHNEKG